ncbi:adenylosuccinate lyase [candidate division KSB1 bacterium]|nr:adenylosuccinate lyase [candidate division KSB1 bacterium]
MLERYTLPEMGEVWSEEHKFETWLRVEIAVCEAQAEMGLIPKEAVSVIREKAAFDVGRIQEIEEKVNHDVIAFLTNVAENVGAEARYVHLGMTSSDVLDTASALRLQEAGDIISRKIESLKSLLAGKALQYRDRVMIGRTHGMHSEPITLGLKFAVYFYEMGRNIQRFQRALDGISFGKISGAVGTFAFLDPSIEEKTCSLLGLKPAPISTQVLQRDRHAEFLTTLAIIAGSLEKIATEIRNLQRTEILEVEEPFGKGQKGSSAMPHKRNPITCERIVGLARMVRANAMVALENIALWHERDLTHSSAERIIFPDTTILIDYMLEKTIAVLENLTVYPENMEANLNLLNGLIFSQAVLLALVKKGMDREGAYRIVQRNAMAASRARENFKEKISGDKTIKKLLTLEEIEDCFDLKTHLRNIDRIYERAGLGSVNQRGG